MWRTADESIRQRIKDNVVNTARTRMIVYLLMIFAVCVVAFFVVNSGEDGGIMSVPVLVFFMLLIGVGVIAVFYIYFSMIRENTKIVSTAPFMILGKVVTRVGDGKVCKVMVRIPGEKVTFTIDCEPEFYKNCTADSSVLIFATSKKNEDQMMGYDPSTYDKDGIL